MTSLKRTDGELTIDLRAAPGLPGEIAIPMGLPEIKNGGMYTGATMYCHHCGGHVNINHLRVRPREYCKKCDGYYCDGCARAAAEPGYVHRSFKEISDLVRAGTHVITGGTAHAPILTPVSIIL